MSIWKDASTDIMAASMEDMIPGASVVTGWVGRKCVPAEVTEGSWAVRAGSFLNVLCKKGRESGFCHTYGVGDAARVEETKTMRKYMKCIL